MYFFQICCATNNLEYIASSRTKTFFREKTKPKIYTLYFRSGTWLIFVIFVLHLRYTLSLQSFYILSPVTLYV